MRTRFVRRLAIIILTIVGFVTVLPRTIGQQPARPLPQSVQQAGMTAPPIVPPGQSLADLPPVAQEILRTAHGGAEWLCRAHQGNGRFLPGWIPDLNQPVDGDHFLRQAEATLALARSARVFRDERYAAHARQAVLTLLTETGPDSADSKARCTTLPSTVVNRLGATGLLLAAICELPEPAP